MSTGLNYRWPQAFFQGALGGLVHHKSNGRERRKEERLLAENQRVKEIIAEIALENLPLKKSLGE